MFSESLVSGVVLSFELELKLELMYLVFGYAFRFFIRELEFLNYFKLCILSDLIVGVGERSKLKCLFSFVVVFAFFGSNWGTFWVGLNNLMALEPWAKFWIPLPPLCKLTLSKFLRANFCFSCCVSSILSMRWISEPIKGVIPIPIPVPVPVSVPVQPCLLYCSYCSRADRLVLTALQICSLLLQSSVLMSWLNVVSCSIFWCLILSIRVYLLSCLI